MVILECQMCNAYTKTLFVIHGCHMCKRCADIELEYLEVDL